MVQPLLGGGPRLGQELVRRGLLTPHQLRWALEQQARTGVMLGRVLVVAGLVDRRDLRDALASPWACEPADFATLDPALVAGLDPRRLAREGWMPLRAAPGRLVVATAAEPSEELAARVRAEFAGVHTVTFEASTFFDLVAALRRTCEDVVGYEAAVGLADRVPDESARTLLARWQKIAGVGVLAALAASLLLMTTPTLVALALLVNVAYAAGILFKFVVSLAGARAERDGPAAPAPCPDKDLPVYTVLVPLYREAAVVGELVENLGRLDYPPEKLEILLLLEEHDDETIAAARAAADSATMQVVVIPAGHPTTKPKACNVGLFFARGEYLVIYDAEDRPDPDQLRKAVARFRAGDEQTVCLQAALNYYNAEQNVLTRMFTLEYSYWFDYMLPGLDRLHLPIPLGGTSNHFRTESLRELGGWDPYNVTEDADLGIRAAARGAHVGVVDSTTFEEANSRVGNWIRQRSRWIKGYMQTAVVHLRRPMHLVRTAGWRQALSFALLIGGTPATFLAAPPLWALFGLSLLMRGSAITEILPALVLYLSFFDLLIGNAMMIYLSMMGSFRRERYLLVPWSLLNPLYWILHSVAAYKALGQLVTRPHYWEKTLHGLAQPSRGTGGLATAAGAGTLAG